MQPPPKKHSPPSGSPGRSSASDRRASRRYVVQYHLEAMDRSEMFGIETKDLSETGLSFSSEKEIPIDSTVIINLGYYPVDFALELVVRWRKAICPGKYLYGAEFTNLEEADRLLLKSRILSLEVEKARAFILF